jgi:hypothetical protein
MPDLDFSDVLASPEFVDSFSVVSTARTITSGGVESDTPAAPVGARGVVVPGKSSLRRLEDGARVGAFIDIYTTYRLSAGVKTNDTTSRDADIVTWHGRQFTVMMVEDYSAFGAGWIHASCDLLALNPTS